MIEEMRERGIREAVRRIDHTRAAGRAKQRQIKSYAGCGTREAALRSCGLRDAGCGAQL